MTIFVLIDEQDTEAAWGCNVKSFLDVDAARVAMQQDFENALANWEFDTSVDTEEHYAECNALFHGNEAVIRDGSDVESWRIEEQELAVQVAVEVKGGLVQNIYANADISPDVYDLDISDFPDEGEEDEVDRKQAELNALVKTTGWRNVY